MPQRARKRDPAHLARVAQLSCLACGARPVHVAHIRYADAWYGKGITGIGIKPDDKWTVPLCPRCHRDQHSHGERDWWEAHRINPLTVARKLYAISTLIDEPRDDGKIGDMERVIRTVRGGVPD